MGSSWALVCSTAVCWVLLGSGCGEMQSPDESLMLQRPLTPREILEMQTPDESLMLQRPLDPIEILGMEYPDSLLLQKPLVGRPEIMPRGRRPAIPALDERYPVQFPLGRPTSNNLQAICLNGDLRPRYPESYFPLSGFGSQKRRGSAVNKAESWFSTCCKMNQTWEREVTLCCAIRAWRLSIKSFCEEEFSIKTAHYHCCLKHGKKRLNCFNDNALNPNYEPTEGIPVSPLPSTTKFKFDPSTCQREMEPPNQKTDINFPPGRPTEDSIQSLCRNQILRPVYNVECMPGAGYQWLVHQAKTINRMEKGFKQCCKLENRLNCAEQKWRDELNTFCLDKKSRPLNFNCCLADGTNERYSCFQQIAPDPHYMTIAREEVSLNKICDTHKIIKKMFPSLPLKSFVDKCCPLSEEEKDTCFMKKFEEICSSRGGSPAIRHCCRGSRQKTPQCISKILMDAITKATNVLSRKKKKCPIS
ncbi:extracellular matrix protein 1 isoform X2 [Anabas testudineus]|uniref:extracellular matrix protein 1 isoform X2 n=1 Tax=Anabas testudineus TaxID=64144 RepID=UPI000E459F76|nr:extracellular matrix protein 1 isoform X2 [Anabas testudineus]